MSTTFKSGRVTVDSSGIHVAWYYFPAGTKTVKFEDIERIELIDSYLNSKSWGETITAGKWAWWNLGMFREFSSSDGMLIITKNNPGTFFYPGIGITPPDVKGTFDAIQKESEKKGLTLQVRGKQQ
jgi:hypothetical protein